MAELCKKRSTVQPPGALPRIGIIAGIPVPETAELQAADPAQTPLAVEISKALKGKGYKFVGPVIVYAWMQAVGLVNDHLTCCHRHAPIKAMGAG